MCIVNLIKNYIKAGYPAIAIKTVEEKRALEEIMQAVSQTKKSLVVWSALEGLMQIEPTHKKIEDSQDPTAAFSKILEKTVYVFLDTHTFPIDKDPILERTIKEMLQSVSSKGSCVIFLGSQFKGAQSFKHMVTVLDFTLPSEAVLGKLLDISINDIEEGTNGKTKINLSVDEKELIIKALSGLSTTEAVNALILSFVETQKIDAKVIYREKTLAVKRSGLLELIEADPKGLGSIGGLEILKDYITKRKSAFTKEAAEYGLPAPKGILLVGVPGTGKSLSAKAVGAVLEIPTLKLDIGALFNSLVGESEARTREALALAEAVSPCVLWIDEVEKGLAGAGGSGSNDSGVTKRVFGTILNWMQERQRPVFLIATANQIQHLPPEFIRRWDEVFAVDLPTDSERAEIFKIHIEKTKREVGKFDMAAIVKDSEGYTGAEIEKTIHAAMYNAFSSSREYTTKDILQALSDLCPISATMKEQINAVRAEIGKRYRRASAEATAAKPSTGKRNLDM